MSGNNDVRSGQSILNKNHYRIFNVAVALPGKNDAKAGGAYPCPDHKGAVKKDVYPGLGLHYANLAQAGWQTGHELQETQAYNTHIRGHRTAHYVAMLTWKD